MQILWGEHHSKWVGMQHYQEEVRIAQTLSMLFGKPNSAEIAASWQISTCSKSVTAHPASSLNQKWADGANGRRKVGGGKSESRQKRYRGCRTWSDKPGVGFFPGWFFLCVLFWFFLIFPRVTEFREWGGIILCPTCEWLYLLAMWVEMKLLHTSFSDQSLRFGDSLLLPDAVLMSILLAGFPLQMWQWTCVDGIKWHTCPDLKRSCFTPAEDLLKNSFLCWFGGGWMADNDQKQKCHYSFCSPFYQHNNACTVQGFSFSPLLSIHFKPSI